MGIPKTWGYPNHCDTATSTKSAFPSQSSMMLSVVTGNNFCLADKKAKLQNAGPLTHISKRAGSFAHCRAKRATTYIRTTLKRSNNSFLVLFIHCRAKRAKRATTYIHPTLEHSQVIHFSFFLSNAKPNEPPHICIQHLNTLI